jgi:thiol-disulfide isomerase/thioredoxin
MSFKTYAHLEDQPVDFIQFMDSLQGEMKMMVAAAEEELNQQFQTMLDADIKYSTLTRWNAYKQYAGRFNHDLDQPMVRQFDQRLKADIRLNDPGAMASSFYKSFLEDTLRKFARNQIDIQALREKHTSREELSQAYMESLFTQGFNAIDSLIQTPAIKAHSYYHTLLRNMRIDRLDQLKNIYNERFKTMVNQEDQQQVIENKLAELEKMTPGNPAPGFTYPDKDGKMVSLEDLKGRYVYLDIWATWCGPCLAEIPKMKELHEKYGDKVAFVSVSVDPEKDKWMRFLEEKELKGYQLYSGDNFQSEIMKDYMIQGIPRFVMIDPQGNLLDVDAPRPTSKKTEAIIKAWIEKGA